MERVGRTPVTDAPFFATCRHVTIPLMVGGWFVMDLRAYWRIDEYPTQYIYIFILRRMGKNKALAQ